MDDTTMVLHWFEHSWRRIDMESWMSFRGLAEPWQPLPNVRAGKHYFLYCIIEGDRLCQILPHRYLVDGDGRIADDGYFGVLSLDEINRYKALNKRHYEYPQTHPLNGPEQVEFDGIRERLWQSWLPPSYAMCELMRVVSAMPHADDPAWQALEAAGLSRGGATLN